MVERYVKTIEKHEFYEYEVTQYDPPTGKGGNFVQYIDKFLKSKVEGSGSPGWVQTPEDEDKFVKYFLEEGHWALQDSDPERSQGDPTLSQLILGLADGIE